MALDTDHNSPDGFRIELHTQISAPITLGGVPRNLAILVGTIALVISLGLKAPFLGIPLGIGLWAVSYALTKDDPHFFEALKRHLHHPPHLEG
ncbi:MAG: VirB3 family type IV secretion system protein [Pseudomonadota bacterium]|jgi:type IV secretion system protein VirB3